MSTRLPVGTRKALSLLLLLVTAGSGCTAVRNFLIPPPRSSASLREAHEADSDGAGAGRRDHGPAETVLLVGSVTGHPEARAIALRGGRIAYVGPAAGAEPLTAASTEVHRLPDAVALPPLRDQHVRLAEQLQRLDGLDARRLTSVSQLRERANMRCAALADDDWLWVFDADPALVDQLRAKPDALAGTCPLLVSSRGEAAGLINASAHALLGGVLPGLPSSGVLNGPAVLRQVRAALPAQRLSRQKPLLVQSLQAARQLGWSEVEAVDGSPALVDALQALAVEGRLPLPVRVWLQHRPGMPIPALTRRLPAAGLVIQAGIALEWPPVALPGAATPTVSEALASLASDNQPVLFLPASAADQLAAAKDLCVASQSFAHPVRLDGVFAGSEAEWKTALACGSAAPRLMCTVLGPLREGSGVGPAALQPVCKSVGFGSGLPAGVASPADVSAAVGTGSNPAAVAHDSAGLQPGQPADLILWRNKGDVWTPLLTVVRGRLLQLAPR